MQRRQRRSHEGRAARRAGHLLVSAPAAFGRKHVALHGPSFVAKNPGVQASFNLNDQVVDLVRQGFDMGVRIGGAIDPSVRRHQARGESARRLRDVGLFRSPRRAAHARRPRAATTASRSICRAASKAAGISGIGDKPVTIRVSGNLDCNDGELLHRWTAGRPGLELAVDMGDPGSARPR